MSSVSFHGLMAQILALINCLEAPPFIHRSPPESQSVGSCQVGAVMNTAAVNILVQAFLFTLFWTPLGKYQGVWSVDPSGETTFTFKEMAKPFSKVTTNLHSQQQWKNSCRSTSWPTFGVISVLDVSHSHGYGKLSHYYVILQFSTEVWCWTSFLKCVCHLYIIFDCSDHLNF